MLEVYLRETEKWLETSLEEFYAAGYTGPFILKPQLLQGNRGKRGLNMKVMLHPDKRRTAIIRSNKKETPHFWLDNYVNKR